ncbi:hypothetical protein AZH47_06065 [Corynebacterium striatum]|nr:hypothetical protein AZH47_06065 [Corynebacterium striatum]
MGRSAGKRGQGAPGATFRCFIARVATNLLTKVCGARQTPLNRDVYGWATVAVGAPLAGPCALPFRRDEKISALLLMWRK